MNKLWITDFFFYPTRQVFVLLEIDSPFSLKKIPTLNNVNKEAEEKTNA